MLQLCYTNQTDKVSHPVDLESTQSNIYQEPTGSHWALFVVLEYWLCPRNTRGRPRASAVRKTSLQNRKLNDPSLQESLA